jgi:alpha-tubulin suppressor-like RCC1 family protein
MTNPRRMQMAASGAIAESNLWTWGRNNKGQLGDETTVNQSSPIQVGALTDWSVVSAGSGSTVALKTDGTLWSWGYNNHGQLGDGTTTDRSSPTQVGALTDWVNLTSYGYDSFKSIKANGTLWAWGINGEGNLGDGTQVNKSSPVQIGALTNWATVASGNSHTTAVKTNGTLWAWGLNTYGRLGDGTLIRKISPIQIGGLTNWATVANGHSHSAAVKTDGTLWTWGFNNNGQLGDGTTGRKYSPVQIGSGFANGVWAGQRHLLAVKTNGTLWGWGRNDLGQLGDGTSANKSVPVQIGSLTDWAGATIATGAHHNVVVKTDGTLWTWGNGYAGKLVTGTSDNQSSPIQIGSLTDWVSAAAGGHHSVGLK